MKYFWILLKYFWNILKYFQKSKTFQKNKKIKNKLKIFRYFEKIKIFRKLKKNIDLLLPRKWEEMEGNRWKFKITSIVNEHHKFFEISKSKFSKFCRSNLIKLMDYTDHVASQISWLYCETISLSCTGKLPQGTMGIMGSWLCHNDLVTFTDK